MRANGERSARDYSREADATRQRISRTVDELTDRLTVGQVLDEVLGYAKGGGGTMASAFTRAARENPIPSLLVSAGCMMFLSERLGLPRRASAGSPSGLANAGTSVKRGVTEGIRTGQEGIAAAGEQVGNLGKQVFDRAASAAQSAG